MSKNKIRKPLAGKALKAVYRAILRATRSKYFPHVGEKQKQKEKEKTND